MILAMKRPWTAREVRRSRRAILMRLKWEPRTPDQYQKKSYLGRTRLTGQSRNGP